MALRDSWHRVLVYFGLAEAGDPYEDELDESPGAVAAPEAELENRYRERPNVRRLSSRRRRDEIDDIFAEEPSSERRTTALRPVGGGGRPNGRAQEVRMHLVVPKSFNDAQDVGDKFKDSIPVIINLQTAEPVLSKRVIDFACGLTYALDGGIQEVASKVFLLTPRNVEVSAEQRAQLVEKGFFNQS
jgi:cell division inhibitor SepF